MTLSEWWQSVTILKTYLKFEFQVILRKFIQNLETHNVISHNSQSQCYDAAKFLNKKHKDVCRRRKYAVAPSDSVKFMVVTVFYDLLLFFCFFQRV